MSDWGVIFDMDGVLVDSSQAHFEAWKWLGEREGVPFSEGFFQQTFGMHNQQILPLWLERELPQSEVDRLAFAKEARYRELAPTLLKPIEGVLSLIGQLSEQGVLLAVGSSGPLPNIRLILQTLGLEQAFRALSTGEDVTHGKPDPEVFLVAARRLGLPPQRCLVVEDAPQGVEAARRAGMAVLAITSSRPAGDLPADRVVDRFQGVTPAQLMTLLPTWVGEESPQP